jgi:prevent-host-death family protein
VAKSIPHRELRNQSSAVLRRVQAGETLHVTNHGEVVAVLSPPDTVVGPRIVPAKRQGGFAAIPRVRVTEETSSALDELRGE